MVENIIIAILFRGIIYKDLFDAEISWQSVKKVVKFENSGTIYFRLATVNLRSG